MIDGLILGLLSWLSLMLSWYHLPEWIKTWTLKHPVISDFVGSWLSFMFLSGISHSVVAVAGAIVAGLLINFTIIGLNWWYGNETKQH